MDIKEKLEILGHTVSLPNSFNEPFAENKMKKFGNEKHSEWKANMMRRDKQNIQPQDAILVLNFEKNKIPNYIGGATFMEIIKAWELGKKIFFYSPLPNCCFTDELRGISPVILNGDLNLIK